MKQTVFIILGIFIIVFIGFQGYNHSNNNEHIRLPHVEGLNKEAIQTVFEDYPWEVVFEEEISLCTLEPSVFLYYQDYDAGDEVIASETVTIVIAAPSEE